MKPAHLKTAAIALTTLWFAGSALATTRDFTSADRVSLELGRVDSLSMLIDTNFSGTSAFADSAKAPGSTPTAVFADLRTPLESRIFLQNRMAAMQLEAISDLPAAAPTNAPVPEPSSLITAIVCGCGVLLGIQRLRRRKF